jgi:hypothetical protein
MSKMTPEEFVAFTKTEEWHKQTTAERLAFMNEYCRERLSVVMVTCENASHISSQQVETLVAQMRERWNDPEYGLRFDYMNDGDPNITLDEFRAEQKQQGRYGRHAKSKR